MTKTLNRQVQLVRRPQGAPVPGDFRIVDGRVPAPSEGQMLLRNLYLSLDPYMRGRMNDSRDSYAPPYALDAPLGGGTVARVVRSRLDSFAEGDLVVTPDAGWQTFAISDGIGLRRLPNDMEQPSQALGVLGMTGFTAWWGLTAIGRPRAGETLVVSAAAGAVGSVVGQIGRLLGCRVVGIAGGADKCRQVVEEMSFDACLDYRAPDLPVRLREAAPDGIDIYFENVGGAVREAVWPFLNNDARVPLCGLVSGYNGITEGTGGIHALLMSLIVKRIRLQGFMNAEHLDCFSDFERQMRGWLDAGHLRAHETIVDGLDQAPAAFVGLFEGHNTGKLVVRLPE
ncbi:NADPH-dependent curcumin reductase CurA [Pseudorhizobium tarimense]|uniref:NADPH-dependent curcumin reductase CurA n=1 Tax=Pseudorhizobium tarimense TaxID=1079109 RepID=A0ABV2HE33_9HYPH|nr:NADP-dependent oxidoreductase [Pseudorhizobium tarimense]MCJ8520981.1 NADP-dependent oxidoreductase [Pseudorhizobium tarimense]MCJ8521038.1 NADP-dependent oxidoreductase [Pseudorhizobium tarimense]